MKDRTLLFESYSRDGILRHQFDKKHEYFALCYSQSLLLTDFKENPTFVLNIHIKKSEKQEN
jgi:hypothetical protein